MLSYWHDKEKNSACGLGVFPRAREKVRFAGRQDRRQAVTGNDDGCAAESARPESSGGKRKSAGEKSGRKAKASGGEGGVTMVARNALAPKVLEEIGWLTVNYSGLEKLLIDLVACLVNSGDQEPSREIVSRMGFREKRETLGRLFRERCLQIKPDCASAMTGALESCESAGNARNDLVHGIAEYDEGLVFVTRPGGRRRDVTLPEVQRVNELLADAYMKTFNAFVLLWNEVKGDFPPMVRERK